MAVDIQTVTLAIILGTLMAIVYSLRILVLLERRIARMDHHLELMTMAVLKDEKQLLTEETTIERLVNKSKGPAKRARKSSKKKSKK